MSRRTCLLLGCIVLLGALPEGRLRAAAPATGAGTIIVAMEDCKATRPGVPKGILDLLAGTREQLVKRGVVVVEGKKYTLYLPKAKAYTVRNTSKKDHHYENTSTRLSIDQKGDGKLTETDHWFANLPVRLGDRMFDVAEIARDGSRVVLRSSKEPLRGAIVGRACPPFSFKTADGKTVSRDGFDGRAFLLDVWSIT
jgi:hypothetical protein